ncbi:MAG: hypothetical protein U0103_10450 [Candidatus Obscuribacterales bacterium]
MNAAKARLMADDCAVHITHTQSFTGNLLHYAQVLPATMSPILMVVFLVGLCAARNIVFRQLYPLLFSAVGGVVAVSTLGWILPKPQYIAPALITSAVVSGCFLGLLFESRNMWMKRCGWLLLVTATLQIVSLEFAPYPISSPQWISNFGRATGNTISEPRLGITFVNPRPDVDWGQYWSMRGNREGRCRTHKVYLNILSNSPDLNVHTFELIAHDLNSLVVPTTSRSYTIGGDKVHFSPAEALYYQWYLVAKRKSLSGFC